MSTAGNIQGLWNELLTLIEQHRLEHDDDDLEQG